MRGISQIIRDLPLAHRVVAGSGLVVLALVGIMFYQWVSTPSYAVLYAGLDDNAVAEVIQGLDAQGVDYRLEAGGSQILVPRSMVHEARAMLAADGIRGGASQEGYELLDEQGLSVSEFKQQIDYQRALEGELARTLMAMDSISAATVHLVLPEEALFSENQESATASVVVDTASALRGDEVETIAFVVASAVEGLETSEVTIAHVDGEILHAPGDADIAGAFGNRNLRTIEEFEMSLTDNVEALLESVMGPGRASVVVRAEMNFDEQTIESESYEPETAVPVREQLLDEKLDGAGTPPVGTVGVDGEEIATDTDGAYTYERNESTTEYGVNRVATVSRTAPGQLERLSVAVVIDDGSLTGGTSPAAADVEALVAAAIGIDAARGDAIQVTAAAFPAADQGDTTGADAAPEASAGSDAMTQYAGAAAVVMIVVALLFMTRSGKGRAGRRKSTIDDAAGETMTLPAGTSPAALPAGAARAPAPLSNVDPDALEHTVRSLASEKPEDVAALVSDWLKESTPA
jgi:flagellar M-ring protein FliF